MDTANLPQRLVSRLADGLSAAFGRRKDSFHMKFSDIIGQNAVKTHLMTAVEQGKVSQAYIISGEKGSGKKMMANAFAAYLLCSDRHGDACGQCPSCTKLAHGNHPDVIYVTHEKTAITVDDIREQITGTVDIRPYESEKKVYIVDEAEKMNLEAQNAILKTLENPPEYVVILLLTENAWAFLPTILSRCVRLDLKPLPEKTIEDYLMKNLGQPDYMASLYAHFAQGNLGKAVTAASDEDFRTRRGAVVDLVKNISGQPFYQYERAAEELATDKGAIPDYLDLISLWYRDVLLYKAARADDRLCYSDEAYAIRGAAENLTYDRLNRIFDAIETSRAKAAANVRADVVLTDLFALMAAK